MFKTEILSLCPTPYPQHLTARQKDGSTVKMDIHCLALVEVTDTEDADGTYREVTPVVFHQGGLCHFEELNDIGMSLIQIHQTL